MDQIKVRKAGLHDIDTLLGFEQGVISSERPFDPTLKKGLIHYYDIGGMIADTNVDIIVAEVNDRIIASGYARIETAKPYLRHPQHAYLGFMYVDPVHRGNGVNAIIINALRQSVIERGITEMRLDVYYDNAAAIRAYEKIGFARHMIEMRMSVEDLALHNSTDLSK